MIKFFKRFWNYLTAGANQKFNEKADPKIQLEQAITEAQEQHRRLKEQAASVIAQQKLAATRLERGMAELENVNRNARQAVLMAEEATKKGDTAKATDYSRAAESFAVRLVQLEKDVEDMRAMSLQTTQAAEQAKQAVSRNGQVLQQKLAERQQLLSQLEQSKMQEQMNTAMAQLSETVGQDVPTFNEVRDKIEARYAKAKGMAEIQGETVESRMMEIEQAAQNSEAQVRLSQIRAELGLEPAGEEAAAAASVEAEIAKAAAAPAPPATEPAAGEGQAQPG
jgi:phage shock protein A